MQASRIEKKTWTAPTLVLHGAVESLTGKKVGGLADGNGGLTPEPFGS